MSTTYHSFQQSTVPGISDAEHGKVHALDPETLTALCGFTGAYPCGPMAITCQKCAKVMRSKEGN